MTLFTDEWRAEAHPSACSHVKRDRKSAVEPYGDGVLGRCSLCGDDSFEIAPAAANPADIDGPEHYGGKDNPYEAIKVMLAWYGPIRTADFCQINAVKYLARAGKKAESPEGYDGSGNAKITDLRKAAWYAKAAADIIEFGKVRP